MTFFVKQFKTSRQHVVHWTVYVLNKMTNELVFLRSFFTEQRALNFIEDVKKQCAKGDYSCLNLRT